MTPRILARADQDLWEQVLYYERAGAPEVGQLFLLGFDQALELIQNLPNVGKMTEGQQTPLAGTRSLPIPGFKHVRVYYYADPDQIVVVRVFHAARDLDRA